MITEQFLAALAKRFDLKAEKRITAGGPTRAHFATLSLMGAQVYKAWQVIERVRTSPGQATLETVNVQEHPDFGQLFIECQSVWCQPESGDSVRIPTAAEEWADFWKTVMPKHHLVSDLQTRESRRCFYGGFLSALGLLNRLGEDNVSEDAGALVLQKLWDEVGQFYADVKEGRS